MKRQYSGSRFGILYFLLNLAPIFSSAYLIDLSLANATSPVHALCHGAPPTIYDFERLGRPRPIEWEYRLLDDGSGVGEAFIGEADGDFFMLACSPEGREPTFVFQFGDGTPLLTQGRIARISLEVDGDVVLYGDAACRQLGGSRYCYPRDLEAADWRPTFAVCNGERAIVRVIAFEPLYEIETSISLHGSWAAIQQLPCAENFDPAARRR